MLYRAKQSGRKPGRHRAWNGSSPGGAAERGQPSSRRKGENRGFHVEGSRVRRVERWKMEIGEGGGEDFLPVLRTKFQEDHLPERVPAARRAERIAV